MAAEQRKERNIERPEFYQEKRMRKELEIIRELLWEIVRNPRNIQTMVDVFKIERVF